MCHTVRSGVCALTMSDDAAHHRRYPAGNRWSNCWTGNRVFDDDWRAEHYTVEVSHIDTSCKFGNQWYHPSKPDAVKPCSWFQQMACKYGGATPM